MKQLRSMTPEQAEEAFKDACIEEARRVHFKRILLALRAIDIARNGLVEAQNDLVRAVRGMENPYADAVVSQFWREGGVTADEWREFVKTRRPFPEQSEQPAFRLRVVRDQEE